MEDALSMLEDWPHAFTRTNLDQIVGAAELLQAESPAKGNFLMAAIRFNQFIADRLQDELQRRGT